MNELLKKLRKRPEKRERMIFMLCAFALVYLLTSNFYFPNHTKIKELDAKLKQKEEFYVKLKEGLAKLEASTTNNQKTKPLYYYENMANYTYTHGNDLLLKFITSPQILSPLELISITAREEKIEETYVSKEIVMVFSGKFNDVLHMIKKIEALPIIYFIDTIEIGQGLEEFGKIEATIRGNLHGLKTTT